MDEVLLIVLGAALTLVGSIVVQILRSSSDERQWTRGRDERRFDRAATDFARLKVFVNEYGPYMLVVNENPDDPFTEGNRRSSSGEQSGRTQPVSGSFTRACQRG